MCRSIAFLVALAVTASGAGAQNIGLFFDPSGATCSASVTPGVTRTLYILASPGGPTFGLTGYEFRVVGMPDGWVQSVVANPAANVVIGDPFGAVGANGAFGGFCLATPIVSLFTVQFTPTSVVSNHFLRVVPRNPPSNPNFMCPVMTSCDPQAFTMVCTTGGTAILNPTGPGCTVGTEPSSWTQVKGLYTNP